MLAGREWMNLSCSISTVPGTQMELNRQLCMEGSCQLMHFSSQPLLPSRAPLVLVGKILGSKRQLYWKLIPQLLGSTKLTQSLRTQMRFFIQCGELAGALWQMLCSRAAASLKILTVSRFPHIYLLHEVPLLSRKKGTPSSLSFLEHDSECVTIEREVSSQMAAADG